jgi:hypothetical protein
MPTIEDALKVSSREELATFIDALRAEGGTDSTNETLDDYLEALSAFARDFDGLRRNGVWKESTDDPTWALFAALLAGARIYE